MCPSSPTIFSTYGGGIRASHYFINLLDRYYVEY